MPTTIADQDFSRKGDAIYERLVRPVAEPSQNGKFVVINVDTGSFEIDQDEMAAFDRLVAREPSADGRAWFRMIGKPYAHRIGGNRGRKAS